LVLGSLMAVACGGPPAASTPDVSRCGTDEACREACRLAATDPALVNECNGRLIGLRMQQARASAPKPVVSAVAPPPAAATGNGSSGAAPSAPKEASFAEVLNGAMQSVVEVRGARTGVGFAVAEPGLVVTALSSIQGATSVQVLKASGEAFELGQVLGSHSSGLVLISVKNLRLLPLALRSEATPKDSEVGSVVAQQAGGVVSTGRVVGFREVAGSEFLETSVRTGAMSGGAPLLDRQGAVAGVIVSKDEKAALMFAASARHVRELLDRRKPMSLAQFLAGLPQ
jgi:hypothetical protein